MISQSKSYSLTNTKFLLTFFIVYLHCHIQPSVIENVSTNYVLWEKLMQMICDCAVPGFFAISAYLFFLNFDILKYQRKLESRVKSLLIPFLCFSAVGSLFSIMIELVATRNINMSFIDIIRGILTRENNRPLWFLLILFEFALITPAIWYYINKYGKKGVLWGTLILFFINLTLVKTTYVSLFYWSPLLLFFSYLGIEESKGYKLNIPWYFGLLIIPISLIYTLLGVGINHGNPYYIYRLVSGVLIFALGSAFVWKPLAIEKYGMFIYCSHWIIKQLVLFIPSREYLSSVKVLVVFLLCIFVGWLFEHIMPKYYSAITGAR